MNEQYTVDYFIDKFTKEPDENWCRETFEQRIGPKGNSLETKVQHCALGHCGMKHGKLLKEEPEAAALQELFDKVSLSVACVNDYSHIDFPEETSKERILGVLQKIKKHLETNK